MNRTLIWFVPVEHVRGPRSEYGEHYRLDTDYTPVRIWVQTKRAPSAQPVLVDIKDDGQSIIDVMALPVPQIGALGRFLSTVSFLEKDSIITMSLIQGDPSVAGLTIGLELEEA